MKTFIIAVFLLIPSIYAYAEPHIQFEQLQYDAGEVEEGKVVEHVFVFKNTGTSELIIKKVRPS